MKHVYLVCYDIADPMRWKLVFKTIKGYGDALQLSVFRCVLTPEAYVTMVSELREHIHQKEDKILVADLGLLDGRAPKAIVTIGMPISEVVEGPIIL